jgi:hypothetical protein
MTRKLQRDESIEIIQRALGDVRPSRHADLDKALLDVMRKPADRETFRETVARLAREHTFEIDSAAIPLSPNTRFKDLAEALTELAGDPYTTKPRDPPPAPPEPKGKKPKYPGPRKSQTYSEEKEIL